MKRLYAVEGRESNGKRRQWSGLADRSGAAFVYLMMAYPAVRPGTVHVHAVGS